MYLAIDRIGTDVKCKNLEGISMHIQRILLREIVSHRTIGSHRIPRRVIVFSIVARQHVLIDRVGIDHVIVSMIKSCLGIMVNAVANQCLATILHDRTAEKLRLFSLRIVVAILTIDVAATRHDIRRTDDMGTRRSGVIEEGVSRQIELLVAQPNVIVKHRHLRIGMVFPPVRRQHCCTIDEFSAFEEIAEAIHTVIVEGVAIERRLTML